MTTGRPTGFGVMSSASRVRVLHLLQERSPRSIDELVAGTGLHPNTVREHLQRLAADGYVVSTIEERVTRGRPRVLYAATDGHHVSSPVQRQRVRESAERGDLIRRVLPGAASTLDDASLHQVDALIDDLTASGFDPFIDEDDLAIDLTPCTHADAADRALRCDVHLRLMQGVLTEAGGPLSVDGLRPTCDPRACVIQLTRATADLVMR